MSNYRSLNRKHQMELNRNTKIKLRQHLNADSLFASVRCGFEQIQDHRNSNTTIPLADALMSGFAVFSLKDPHYWLMIRDVLGVHITS